MNGILRTWLCQNQRCGAEFDSWERYPCCPTCEGARVEWCPRGGHIAGMSKDADKELRALADIFKMDDINSARRDERAMPKLQQKSVVADGPAMTFGQFSARGINPQAAITANNPYGVQCVPANNVNFKTTAAIGRALPGVGQHRKVT